MLKRIQIHLDCKPLVLHNYETLKEKVGATSLITT